MAQGDPLTMVAYGIGIITLIKITKVEFPDITQIWYSDNASALGTPENAKLYFNSLKRFVPGRGYCPNPLKPFRLCTRKILNPENVLACVNDLKCTRVCVILVVLSRMKSPNVID